LLFCVNLGREGNRERSRIMQFNFFIRIVE